jgi:hypothetical protein
LSLVIDRAAKAGEWAPMQKALVRAAACEHDVHVIADAFGIDVHALHEHRKRVAEKSGRAFWELVESLLVEAALGDADHRSVFAALLSGVAPSAGRSRLRNQTREAALRIESALADTARDLRLEHGEPELARLAVAGFQRQQMASWLDVPLRTIDELASSICTKHGACRLFHVAHDVLRRACGVELGALRRSLAPRLAGVGPPPTGRPWPSKSAMQDGSP